MDPISRSHFNRGCVHLKTRVIRQDSNRCTELVDRAETQPLVETAPLQLLPNT